MPELNCRNYCGKICMSVTPTGCEIFQNCTTTTPPDCTTCYDCEYPEMFYALFGTLIAFILAHSFHKCWINGYGCCSCFWGRGSVNTQYWTVKIPMPDFPYSQLTQPQRPVSRETFVAAAGGFFVLSFIATLVAFLIVNFIDYWVASNINNQEMCLKVWDWQTFHVGNGHWWHKGLFTCQNQVCFYRLFGLIATTWLSLWGLFMYWRYGLVVTVEQQQIKRYEARVEYGAGAGGSLAYGGASPIACTVQ